MTPDSPVVIPGFTVRDLPRPDTESVAVVEADRDSDGLQVSVCLVVPGAVSALEGATRRRIRIDWGQLRTVLATAANDPAAAALLPLVGCGDLGGIPWLAWPRLGPTLADMLADEGPLPVDGLLASTATVARALDVLHGLGTLHRGISPSALVQGPFGVRLVPPLPAELARRRAVVGDERARHAPPELAAQDWTSAGEAYALASTAWTLLAGAVPDAALPRLPRPDVPAAAADALRATLSDRPEHRPTLAELADAMGGRSLDLAEQLTMPPPKGSGPPQGRPLGKGYVLEEIIGRGATGYVWRGHDAAGRQVAVKLLRSELAEDPDVVTRFLREGATLTGLSNPHLVAVRDLIVQGEVLAIVMDLVQGEDLRRLARRRPLALAECAQLLAQTADGLAAVHAAGVVHRDLKPENVLVEVRDGALFALLTDFGLARAMESPALTRLTELVGTPAYVAPEVVAGRNATPAADVYALGVTGYELVSGGRPFLDRNTAALLRAHLESAPPRPENVGETVWALLAACLEKAPELRPSAEAVAEAWRRVAAGLHPWPAALPPLPSAPPPSAPVPSAPVPPPAQHSAPLPTAALTPLRPATGKPAPAPRDRRLLWYVLVVLLLTAGVVTAAVFAR